MKKFILTAACLSMMTSVAFAENAIPENAVEYNGHTYCLIDDVSLDWESAKVHCEKLGGHLATVTSAEEENFLKNLIGEKGTKNSYQLGGYADKIGMWHWVTGEKFSYTHWGAGQPDNYLGMEDVLMMYRKPNPLNPSSSQLGDWNDLRRDGTCNREAFFGTENLGLICEWDK